MSKTLNIYLLRYINDKEISFISTSLLIREMYIKTTMRNFYTSLEWPKFKKLTIPSFCENVEQLELSNIIDGNTTWHKLFENNLTVFYNVKYTVTT